MSATHPAVDAIEMIVQIAGTDAGNMMTAMITSGLVSPAIEATEATVVDIVAVDITDPTKLLVQTFLAAMICSMDLARRTRTWRTESGNRTTR
jgi:pyruvate-formate lyase-activating enzyme